jgi:thiol-disulfide isomerase/thioredoxin/sugar lactone lactonase YvrE
VGELSRVRTRAPELDGRGWLNSPPLTIAGLRGRVVLLDFFTGGCVNCRHALREIAALEGRFGHALQVIGVHSPKFPHEAEPAAVRAAVERLRIPHPVLDDAEHRTLEQYAVRAWPTLVLVGPHGRVEAVGAGEGHGPALGRVVAELLTGARPAPVSGPRSARDDAAPAPATSLPPAAGSPRPPVAGVPGGRLLRHPQGLVRLHGGDLLVADSGHGAVTRLGPDGDRLVRRFEGFDSPGGLALLPDGLAGEVGFDVVVADPGAHALVGLDSATGARRRLAGTGERRVQSSGPPSGPATGEALASPEDVVWWPRAGALVVAMAGLHQLWSFDPRTSALAVLAGTGGEQLRDGPADRALLAQPAGLAVGADGALWFVDAESSALRRLSEGGVSTLVGLGLFAYGHVDGPVAEALLQHPQGLAVSGDGSLLVCDTYNGALRRVDPVAGRVDTVARSLAEPVAAVPTGAGAWLVAESAADRLTLVGSSGA